eukprot:m51a1_g9610 hypothetical protein (1157) ;mRNA; f:1068924-1075665
MGTRAAEVDAAWTAVVNLLRTSFDVSPGEIVGEQDARDFVAQAGVNDRAIAAIVIARWKKLFPGTFLVGAAPQPRAPAPAPALTNITREINTMLLQPLDGEVLGALLAMPRTAEEFEAWHQQLEGVMTAPPPVKIPFGGAIPGEEFPDWLDREHPQRVCTLGARLFIWAQTANLVEGTEMTAQINHNEVFVTVWKEFLMQWPLFTLQFTSKDRSISSASSGSRFPDGSIFVKGVPVYSAEFKASGDYASDDKSMKGARNDILAKFNFVAQFWGPLWFRLSAYGNNKSLQLAVMVDPSVIDPLHVITPAEVPSKKRSNVRLFKLGAPILFNSFKSLCSGMAIAINILRFCRSVSDVLLYDGRVIENGDSRITFAIQGSDVQVEKAFPCSTDRHAELRDIYSRLADVSSPHLVKTRIKSFFFDRIFLDVQPPCYRQNPRTDDELREAVLAVLRALEELHRHSIFHCDIRWPNVLRRCVTREWVLIDLEMYPDVWGHKRSFEVCSVLFPTVCRFVNAAREALSSESAVTTALRQLRARAMLATLLGPLSIADALAVPPTSAHVAREALRAASAVSGGLAALFAGFEALAELPEETAHQRLVGAGCVCRALAALFCSTRGCTAAVREVGRRPGLNRGPVPHGVLLDGLIGTAWALREHVVARVESALDLARLATACPALLGRNARLVSAALWACTAIPRRLLSGRQGTEARQALEEAHLGPAPEWCWTRGFCECCAAGLHEAVAVLARTRELGVTRGSLLRQPAPSPDARHCLEWSIRAAVRGSHTGVLRVLTSPPLSCTPGDLVSSLARHEVIPARLDIVEVLLPAMGPEAAARKGRGLLCRAAYAGDVGLIEYLARNCFYAMPPSTDARNALRWACEGGQAAVVALLARPPFSLGRADAKAVEALAYATKCAGGRGGGRPAAVVAALAMPPYSLGTADARGRPLRVALSACNAEALAALASFPYRLSLDDPPYCLTGAELRSAGAAGHVLERAVATAAPGHQASGDDWRAAVSQVLTKRALHRATGRASFPELLSRLAQHPWSLGKADLLPLMQGVFVFPGLLRAPCLAAIAEQPYGAGKREARELRLLRAAIVQGRADAIEALAREPFGLDRSDLLEHLDALEHRVWQRRQVVRALANPPYCLCERDVSPRDWLLLS